MQMLFFTTANDCLRISQYGKCRCFYILGQLYLKDQKYRFFVDNIIKNPFIFTILDNGVGDEGEIINNDQLIELVKKLHPTEVIPLDYLYDTEKTIQSCEEFIEKLKKIKTSTRILFVPQGSDLQEYLLCYKWALKNPDIATIGLPKKTIPYIFRTKKTTPSIEEARNKLYSMLMKENLIQKPIHLLGCGSVKEFELYKDNSFIRSCDSCIAYLSAVRGCLFTDKDWTRFATPKNLFDINTNIINLMLFGKNKEITYSYIEKPKADVLIGEALTGKSYFADQVKNLKPDLYDRIIEIGDIVRKIARTKQRKFNVNDDLILNHIRQLQIKPNERVLIVGPRTYYITKQLLVLFDLQNVYLLKASIEVRKERFLKDTTIKNKEMKFETLYKREKELRHLIEDLQNYKNYRE